ncbi:MAG: hypothetical protein JSV68_16860 [Anaerolineaceae bacterium]|nr:MAG: hypothetical protein JSV68_16860 [Anaerolineaceae bacterium]
MLPLLELDCTCAEAVTMVKDALDETGLRVLMSFDSQLTRVATVSGVCPHHGTDACDCQIVILLVYDVDGRPATVLAHGQDGETWISMVMPPGQRPAARLEKKIRQALSPLPAVNAGAS